MAYKVGTSLAQAGLLDAGHLGKVQRLGMSTVEEMLDWLAQSEKPESSFRAAQFLEVTNVAELRKRAQKCLSPRAADSEPVARGLSRGGRGGLAAGRGVSPRLEFDPAGSGFVARFATGALPPYRRLMLETLALADLPTAHPASGAPPAVRRTRTSPAGASSSCGTVGARPGRPSPRSSPATACFRLRTSISSTGRRSPWIARRSRGARGARRHARGVSACLAAGLR